jgi:hypothetical protein
MVKYYHTNGVIFSGNEEDPMILKQYTEQGIATSTLMGITNMQVRVSAIKEFWIKAICA